MILQIAALVFVIAITMLNSRYGLFSGLMNALCAIVAMIVALGMFEFAGYASADIMGWSLTWMPAICMAGLFVVTLGALRLLTDNYVRGNVNLPPMVDWIGGALCGFLIAQISVGVMVLAFLMIPFGPNVAMYSRFVRTEADPQTKRMQFARANLWLRSDDFTAALFSFLSGGSLSTGDPAFGEVYPDFPKWVSWTGNTVQEESATAPTGWASDEDLFKGVNVIAWWEKKDAVEGRYCLDIPTREKPDPVYSRTTYAAEPGKRLLGARVELLDVAADSPKAGPNHRFRPTMLRVVGEVNGVVRDYPLRVVAGADPKVQGAFRIADVDNNFAVAAGGGTKLDCYFEVDQDFKPRFIEYRRFARAEFKQDQFADAAPTTPLTAGGPAVAENSASGGQQAQGVGRTRFIDAIVQGRTGQLLDIPINFDRTKIARVSDVELEGELIKSGRVFGNRSAYVPDREGATEVKRLVLPEGRVMFLLTCNSRQAQSIAGGVFNYVAATANQYKAVDSGGNEYPLAGYYAELKRGNNQVFELYYPGPDPAEKNFRHMLDFQHIEKNELRDKDTDLTLIFMVPKGITIVKIENQKGEGIEGLRYEIR